MSTHGNTRFYFFSGKGGVGKTTMACATAIYNARAGKKTLIVTTDPASNLADVFEQAIGSSEVAINGIPNLFGLELDPDEATREYKERTLAPLREILAPASLKIIEEQLSSPCTAEVAAFERFTDFLQAPEYEAVIFDTAPTGHTLRLIQLPGEWSGVIEKAARDGSAGQTCVGPAAALAESKLKFDRALEAMRDGSKSVFTFVLRPEATSIYETKRSVAELKKLGIYSQELIINGVYPAEACDNVFMLHRYIRQQEFLDIIRESFALPATVVELHAGEIKGLPALGEVISQLYEKPVNLSQYRKVSLQGPDGTPASAVDGEANPDVSQLLTPHNGNSRAIFFAGKGGVGKTSVAAATSLWLARHGYKTLLLATDPASHLAEVFEQAITDKPSLIDGENNLWVAHIDPVQAAREYKAKVLAECAAKYDDVRLKAIEEELDSPCTEEMATFEKFIEHATSTGYDVMVFDTAPTGHTLRLLKLPVDWNKQLEIKIFTTLDDSQADKATKARFEQVIAMMQDPDRTTFSFVMYPESTPIEEASRAMQEMAGIGVQTGMVVANMVLPASVLTNPFLKQRKKMQEKYLQQMSQRFQAPIVSLPLLADDLVGREQLAQASIFLYGNGKQGI
ncbi:MAG: TRC40/GET3/ArsA family transport-energizing ATPase [Dehalococcoidaceae bacterium]|nr:TRC40/GET3/ArsA family transport-energizing ATPase [Dehalococcoidaceae bacterium]